MKMDDIHAVWGIIFAGSISTMTRLDPELTVILPCAGSGSRLGLDAPKELYEILPGVRLIDFSLRHIHHYIHSFNKSTPPPLQVVVVTRPWKLSVSDYVQAQLPQLPVRTIFFNDAYHDWPGSVFSAAPAYSERNIVLLPDSFLAVSANDPYRDAAGIPLVEVLNHSLSNQKLVFGAIECNDPMRLKSLGALYVENKRIMRFRDKPQCDFHLYNSFWGCFGFKRCIGTQLYEFMLASVKKHSPPISDEPLLPAAAIPIADYRDLGTWASIESFRADWSSANNWSK